MSINSNQSLKTVGPQTARLLGAINDRSQTIFTLRDAEQITGLTPALASSLLNKAIRRGLVSRLKGGLFIVVPPELGSTTQYGGNPYLIAQSLAGNAQCFLSYGTAIEIHRMVTQPQFVVFASATRLSAGTRTADGIGSGNSPNPEGRAKTGEAVTFRSALVPPYIRKKTASESACAWNSIPIRPD